MNQVEFTKEKPSKNGVYILKTYNNIFDVVSYEDGRFYDEKTAVDVTDVWFSDGFDNFEFALLLIDE